MITVGNLIVIGIVVVILAVYRQMDRNNRSLEKVKRYADKVQLDLDAIVAQKAMELRDMSIEVDVHQKAAREVLKRVQSIEENLNSRAVQMDQIGSRINEYDGALEELVQMTRRVQENVGRIKDESEYVDKVGKRLAVSVQRTTELEQSISSLVERFQTMNAESVARLEESVVTSVQQQVENLDRKVGQTEERVQANLEQIEEQEQQMRLALSAHADEVEERARKSVDSYAERLSAVESDYNARLEAVAARGEKLETSALAKVREHIENRMKATSQELSSSIAEIRTRIEEFQNETGARIDTHDAELRLQMQSVEQDIGALESDLAERRKELDESLAQLEKDSGSQFAEVQSQTRELARAIEADLGREVKTQMAESTDQLRRHVASAQEEFQSEQMRIQAFQKQIEDQRKSVTSAMEASAHELGGRVAEFSKTFSQQLDSRAEEIEHGVIARLEERLSSYEESMGYRFGKIEAVQTDIDSLEGNIRESMEKISTRLKEEITQLGNQLHEKRRLDLEQHGAEMGRIRTSMTELEEGLNELKGRAYDNVSEKLKVFEDEFFADLRDRNMGMESKLNDWQSRVQATLESMAEESRDERQRIEKSFTEELGSRLSEVQTRLLGQYEKLNFQADEFRSALDGRIDAAELAVQALQDSLSRNVDTVEAAAREQLEVQFNRFSENVGAELKKLEKSVDVRIKQIEETSDTGRQDMSAAIESVKSDLTVWRSQVLQQLKAAEAEVEGEFAAYRVQISGTISSMREEFERQKEELVSETSDERNQLREEIMNLSTRLHELEHDLEIRTQTILETLAGEYQQFQSEFQKKSREIQNEADTKIRDHRNVVRDTQDQLELMQQKMFGKVEEDARVLAVNLAEIDKRQKSFIEQTRIFERADTLKDSLAQSIEEMKKEIASVEQQQKELRGIETEFGRLRKLGDDAAERLARFMGEKRRIDSIEEDYKRLITLSQAVELKLQQVTASNDTLAQMQLSLRNLDDMGKDVESRFQRLEKKRSILDVTAEGVDKNFQYLEELEDKIETLKANIDGFPGQVDELFGKLDQLAADRKDVDSAVRQLNSLEKLLGDVEARMENLQTAREWLARTETRLDEISRSAEDQVKLLGTLMKQETKSSAKERGAPSLSARDTVIKLARQGWKVQEIAQATKLSRGEVELILEISHK